jgi:hypothetical protein
MQIPKMSQSLPKLTKFKPPTKVPTTLLSSNNQSSTNSIKSDPPFAALSKGLSSCKRAYDVQEEELDDIWKNEEASMVSHTSSEIVIHSSPSKILVSKVDAYAQKYESYNSQTLEKGYAVDNVVTAPNITSFVTGQSGSNKKQKLNIWGDSDSD